MSTRAIGRHRAPRQPLFGALGSTLTSHTRPAMRATTAVLLAGGLVTSVTVPAGADPDDHANGSDSASVSQEQRSQPLSEQEASVANWSEQTADEQRAQADAAAAWQAATREQAAAQAAREKAAAAQQAAAQEAAAVKKAAAAKRAAAAKKAAAVRKAAVAKRAAAKAAAANADLESASGAMSGGGILGIASGLSGISYRWGGTTTSGFDCSGFTRHVYKRAGINLPRTAAAQQGATRRVSDPLPGDLVFFGSPAHHVGIYAGNGRMYDAPRTGKTTGLHKIWSSNVTYGRAR